MILTLILGILFVKYQRDGWKYMKVRGMYLSDAVKIDGLIRNKQVKYGVDYKIFMNDNELKYEEGIFYDKRDEYNSIPVYPSIDADNVASSWMYILTGMHLAHLLGGLISLIVVTTKSLFKKYNKNDIVGIQVSSIYWHFLGFFVVIFVSPTTIRRLTE
jgi:heme/copper-type cytochrome/quinol oxidase subunit 3